MLIKYSVIIPTYNNAGNIHKCLKAFSDQTVDRKNYEIIVADDGSVDKTREVIQGFPDVIYCYQENQGPGAARNLASTFANGYIFLFTDSDCIPERDWIYEMTKCIEMDSKIVGVRGIYKTKQKMLLAEFVQNEYEIRYKRARKGEDIDFIDTYSAAYRADVFKELRGFNSFLRINEDHEFSYRVANCGYYMVMNDNAKVYHTHASTLSEYLLKKFKIAYWKVWLIKTFPQKAISDTHTHQGLKFQILFSSLSLLFLFLVVVYSHYFLVLFSLCFLSFLYLSYLELRAGRSLGFYKYVLYTGILYLRSLSFALGLLAGFTFMIFKKKQYKKPFSN